MPVKAIEKGEGAVSMSHLMEEVTFEKKILVTWPFSTMPDWHPHLSAMRTCTLTYMKVLEFVYGVDKSTYSSTMLTVP